MYLFIPCSCCHCLKNPARVVGQRDSTLDCQGPGRLCLGKGGPLKAIWHLVPLPGFPVLDSLPATFLAFLLELIYVKKPVIGERCVCFEVRPRRVETVPNLPML